MGHSRQPVSRDSLRNNSVRLLPGLLPPVVVKLSRQTNRALECSIRKQSKNEVLRIKKMCFFMYFLCFVERKNRIDGNSWQYVVVVVDDDETTCTLLGSGVSR